MLTNHEILSTQMSLELRNGEMVQVRPMKSSDGDSIFNFLRTLSKESLRWFHPFPFDRETADIVAGDADDIKSYRLVVTAKDVLISYAYWRPQGRRSRLPLLSIAIADDYQSLGLGRWLMVKLINAALKRNLDGLQLNVFKGNERAINLYTSLGFSFSGETTDGKQHTMQLLFRTETHQLSKPKLNRWIRRITGISSS